jgi:hypothetical protein
MTPSCVTTESAYEHELVHLNHAGVCADGSQCGSGGTAPAPRHGVNNGPLALCTDGLACEDEWETRYNHAHASQTQTVTTTCPPCPPWIPNCCTPQTQTVSVCNPSSVTTALECAAHSSACVWDQSTWSPTVYAADQWTSPEYICDCNLEVTGRVCTKGCSPPWVDHRCEKTPMPTAFPSASPTKFPTAAPTAAPTALPTKVPTLYPTPHPCDDGSHGCELESEGGICYRSTDHSWTCDCASGYWCAFGCSAPYTAHQCTVE